MSGTRYVAEKANAGREHAATPPDKALFEVMQSPLFYGLDHGTTAFVIEHLPEEAFPPGHIVIEDNTPGDTLYIVKNGRIRVSKTLDSGQEHTLVELGPGEFVGEMALLEDKPRSARVSTVTPTSLLAVSRQTFNTLVEQHPTVAVNFLREISARLRLRNQQQELLLGEKQKLVEELASKNVELERALTELKAAMETVAEHERVKRDLEIARQIQQQMLPTDFPRYPGLSLYATTVPSRWVGGDFYDAVSLSPHRVGLLLGDVSGKGIPAAMQMARLMGEFRACVSHRSDPEGVMQVLNELLCQRNIRLSSFVTVQYLVLDFLQGRIQYVCAGHPPILLRHADGRLEQLGEVANIPLGIHDSFVYHHEECQLTGGDTLLLYSDGAYELRNQVGEMMGLPRLAQCFAQMSGPPRAIIQAMQAALDTFQNPPESHPHDDTTLLCAQLSPG